MGVWKKESVNVSFYKNVVKVRNSNKDGLARGY